jgi:hypothetical protein
LEEKREGDETILWCSISLFIVLGKMLLTLSVIVVQNFHFLCGVSHPEEFL